ncbi:type II toxin-antitoxin system RelE/ParE family toxin [Demequina sp. NBRC 110055]|uniref:type II toxin-antitoxin system RelE/ParE family toxin n=1 Tax=Demequina sp. NBRC 110055 TaxID=1570344 RepID=UPI001F3F7AED|nr:type II toxin-antitoxin system RelE/ParE family toxin [Demequina sp. NBRC 110055]
MKAIDRRVQRAALRKRDVLHAAPEVEDLRIPPGIHLELLKGDRAGRHSIRVNDQGRICFRWKNGGADDGELVDDH